MHNIITIDQLKHLMLGTWRSIAPEIRPSATKNADGHLKPFYLNRLFSYFDDDQFSLDIINTADAYGKSALAKISIKGHVAWQGEHPIATGAQKVDFSADTSYSVTPLHQGFADILNQVATAGFNKWEVGMEQSIFGKAFPIFGLAVGQIFKEYDLIYLFNDMLFWGARNIDGRGFDKEENRPTNLQIPLIRMTE